MALTGSSSQRDTEHRAEKSRREERDKEREVRFQPDYYLTEILAALLCCQSESDGDLDSSLRFYAAAHIE
jgi:hypothetical protein